MDDTALTLLGIIVASVGLVGGIIARDRVLTRSISEADKQVRDEMDKKIDVCHERINKTRDDFVRRDDLDQHMKRIEGSLDKMYIEQRETNQRIDGFMSAMVNRDNERRTGTS